MSAPIVHIGVGFQPPNTLLMLAVDRDAAQAKQETELRGKEAQCTSWTVVPIGMRAEIESTLRLWLAENDIIGADASDAVKAFANSVLYMIREVRK